MGRTAASWAAQHGASVPLSTLLLPALRQTAKQHTHISRAAEDLEAALLGVEMKEKGTCEMVLLRILERLAQSNHPGNKALRESAVRLFEQHGSNHSVSRGVHHRTTDAAFLQRPPPTTNPDMENRLGTMADFLLSRWKDQVSIGKQLT